MIEALGDRIVCQAIETEFVKEIGGIIIPDEAQTKDKNNKYTVIGIGGGDEVAKLKLNIGDVVVVNKYAGGDIQHDGIDYRLILCGDIQGRLK